MQTDRVFVCPKCKSLCIAEDWNERKGKCKYCSTNKYHARRIEVDGEWFDSQHEASIYYELLLLQKQGLIHNLERQVVFRLNVEDCFICKYIADFQYYLQNDLVVVDAKGVRTPVYKLKKKLMKAIYNIDIIEK